MRHARRVLAGALLCATVLVLVTAGRAGADDEDSPWPDTRSVPANVRAVKSVVRELERKVELMEESADRYADWESCIRGVPISEYGDPDRRFGYAYDERDGTGVSQMPALAVDRRSRPRKEDYLFFDFAEQDDCRSDPTLPGGTADAASVRTSRDRRRASHANTLTGLERRVEVMKRTARRLEASSERFDEWESCVSWVPVTEYGDPDGRSGYLFDIRLATGFEYRPALAIDRSDWDDPDYMFLAFVGGDRPGRGCQDEPGEGVD